MPATPRERMPIGVWRSDSARIASAMPGASRSITARVASGVTSSGVRPVPPVVKISVERRRRRSGAGGPRSSAEVVGDDLHRVDVGARLLGQPASSGPEASLGLAARDARWRSVRTAVRTGATLGRRVRALGGGDEVAHGVLVARRAAASTGSGSPLTIALEELLAVLVGRQRALRPAARLVEHDRQPRVLLAELLGDLALHALGQRGRGAGRGDRDRQRPGAHDRRAG